MKPNELRMLLYSIKLLCFTSLFMFLRQLAEFKSSICILALRNLQHIEYCHNVYKLVSSCLNVFQLLLWVLFPIMSF